MPTRPTPTVLKIARGNPGKRPLNHNEPKPSATGATRSPAGLSPQARKRWKHVAKHLDDSGILTVLDTDALRLYCDAYARYLEANEHLQTEGMVIETRHTTKANPYVAILNTAADTMLKIMREFGMTPSARTGLEVLPPKTASNPFDEFKPPMEKTR